MAPRCVSVLAVQVGWLGGGDCRACRSEMTGSEPLSLDEEVSMQKSWADDDDSEWRDGGVSEAHDVSAQN